MKPIVELIGEFGLLTPFIGLAAFSISMFAWADAMLHPEIRERAKRWFLPLKNTPNVDAISAFNNLFEAVFTQRHWTWTAAKRSMTATTLFFVATFAFAAILTDAIRDIVTELSASSFDVIFFVSAALIINIAVDYVSLFETRLILKLMNRPMPVRALLLLVDLMLTSLIYYITIRIGLAAFGALSEIITSLSGGQPTVESGGTPGFVLTVGIASVMTTFFSTIWLWLALLGGPIARALVFSRTDVLTFFGRVLDTEKRPFTSLGNVIALLLVVIGVIVWLVERLPLLLR